MPAMALPGAAGKQSTVTPIVVETVKTTTLEDALENLRAERVVYVGETHTSLSDHQLQLQVLKTMAAQGGELVLGVEWFQRPFQPALDRFIAGEIDEKQLLRDTEYFQRWGFDYRLYRDILRYAREQGVRVLALNASRELTDQIGKHGLDGLPDSVIEQKPDSYDFDDAQYATYLKGVFEQHQSRLPGAEKEGAFRRFLEVQLTWDESMAQTVAEYLQANPSARVLVLAGRGHTHDAAIPRRVTRRTNIVGVSIASYETNSPFEQPDYLVLQEPQRLPAQGLIGVGLEEGEDGVVITSISPGSNAKDAGIEIGDRIIRVGDKAISDYMDVRLTMLDRRPGDKLRLRLRREGWLGSEREIDAEVRLIAAGRP